MSTATDNSHQSSALAAALQVPSYPRDVSHFEDGTWLCSSASQLQLTRTFQRYGFTLNPLCLFNEFHEKFSFIKQASALLGTGALDSDMPAGMLQYLRAVESGVAADIEIALANVDIPKALPVNHSIPARLPALALAA